MSILKVYSGGQTGVDRAALDVAIELNIPHAGWCPKGRKAEDGKISVNYSLTETDSSNYLTRTKRNVEDTEATLILFINNYDGGTKYTYDYANIIKKPVLTVDIDQIVDLNEITSWLNQNNFNLLNIAGPRESKQPGIYSKARAVLSELLNTLKYESDD